MYWGFDEFLAKRAQLACFKIKIYEPNLIADFIMHNNLNLITKYNMEVMEWPKISDIDRLINLG